MDTQRTDAESNDTQSGFDRAVEAYRRALEPLVAGDPRPVTEFFSRRDDVTLANPLGPVRRGPSDVDRAIAEAAAQLRDGGIRDFEEVSRYRTSDLGYVHRHRDVAIDPQLGCRSGWMATCRLMPRPGWLDLGLPVSLQR